MSCGSAVRSKTKAPIARGLWIKPGSRPYQGRVTYFFFFGAAFFFAAAFFVAFFIEWFSYHRNFAIKKKIAM
jgi:hypothetical protein